MAAQVPKKGIPYVAGSKRPLAIYASKLVKVFASKMTWSDGLAFVGKPERKVARCPAARVS